MIQTNQQPFQYFQNQTKLQQLSYYSLMGLLQQVHLVIKNQESISSQIVGMMSRMSLIVSFILQYILLIHVNSIEHYPIEICFKDVYESLIHGTSWKEVNFHVHNRLFNHLHKLCILHMDGTILIFKMHHNQHHQGQHFQVVDRIYWYIIKERWRVRELYPHLLSV